ncbi:hypothetical protein G6F24_018180 [Rhizopus arrhizus]|nr:hypothetical protein G6F24_018180 [Rhizopus arrhizus]
MPPASSMAWRVTSVVSSSCTPEMISGVRASSTSTLSASSTMAKHRPRRYSWFSLPCAPRKRSRRSASSSLSLSSTIRSRR